MKNDATSNRADAMWANQHSAGSYKICLINQNYVSHSLFSTYIFSLK